MTERQLGLDAFRNGRLREAADRLRAAAADHERTVSQQIGFQTYAYLGAALYALGDAAEASAVFSAAVTLSPSTPPPLDLMINLANASLASGKRQVAEETLTQALRDNPGAMEARMLLERLRSRAESLPLTGSVLGESPESAKRYMDTLSFSSVGSGYAPSEVRTALGQIQHYLDALASRLIEKDQTISDLTAEIQRLRQSEETLIENMLQARQEADRLRNSLDHQPMESPSFDNGQSITGGEEPADLTPLEKLFQKKTV